MPSVPLRLPRQGDEKDVLNPMMEPLKYAASADTPPLEVCERVLKRPPFQVESRKLRPRRL